jgi:glycerol uptake facilitator protein
MEKENLPAELVAEFVGTFLLILLGNGAVATSVWAGAYDLWAVAFMWGLAVALAVYAAGAISGAHINPAVTVAMAGFSNGFDNRKMLPYILIQIFAAFVASAAIHAAYGGIAEAFEASNEIVRGEMGSQLSAMAYTTYAPNPAIIGTDTASLLTVSHTRWFVSEMIITAVLVFGVFYLIEETNAGRPLANMHALFIGLLVAALVAYEAPVSMAALNPARDIGPRFWAYLAGWGEIAFPGPRGGFWIPTASTLAGGIIGGALYRYLYAPLYPTPAEEGRVPEEVEGE